MKNLFLTLVAALFVNTAFAFPSSEEPKTVLAQTSKELSHLLNSVQSEGFLEKEEFVTIFFVVNDLNQIVVLKVDSDNPEIQSHVKNTLNYKKLSSRGMTVGKTYFFMADFKSLK